MLLLLLLALSGVASIPTINLASQHRMLYASSTPQACTSSTHCPEGFSLLADLDK